MDAKLPLKVPLRGQRWFRWANIALVIVITLLVMNPQYAFLNVLLDGATLDLLLLLIGVQMLLWREQWSIGRAMLRNLWPQKKRP